MKIQWFGHSCFLIESQAGLKIITDPFDQSVGYKIPDVPPDIVVTSHDHFDHGAIKVLKGKPEVVKGSGEHKVKGINFKGVSTFHDSASGTQRGRNTVFVFEVDGITLCHLGDLGHVPDHKQAEHIGPIDILFIPVGGTFTINAKEADQTIERLRPRMVIPMHYKTPAIDFPIDPVDKFLIGKENVDRLDSNVLEITPEELPRQTRILVLKYE